MIDHGRLFRFIRNKKHISANIISFTIPLLMPH